jgi:dipeptidyl aminopeptidase/acylaminoacyl peptidase
MTRGGLTSGDLALLRLASDPQASADGTVAYVQSWLDLEADVTRCSVALTGPSGTTRADTAVPAPGADTWRPRWSPDGSTLAMISATAGAARVVLWRPGSPEIVPLAEGPGTVTDLDWSPDGRTLAVTCVRYEAAPDSASRAHPAGAAYVDGLAGLVREERQVLALPADGSAARHVLDNAWSPRWSPTGSRLAFLSRPAAGTAAWLCVADPARPAEITRVAADAVAFTWSPAGDELAYLAPPPGYPADIDCRLFRCCVGSGQAAEPTELAARWDRSIGSTVRADDARGTGPQAPAWSAATGRIYFCVADGGQGQIGWAGRDPADYGLLRTGSRSVMELSISGRGDTLAYVSTDPADPGSVCVTELPSGAERQRTSLNGRLAGRRLAPVRHIRARAADGTPVDGWLTGAGPGRPLVVSIHGGPHYPAGYRFSAEAQRLAARGYAVLTANPRGSGGYGRQFAAAVRGGWGTRDWTDVTAVIDAAVAEHGLDGSRTAVTGVSYGGYLAMRAITLTARFRAAISENGISNLLALWGTGAEDPDWLAGEMGGPPWERAQAYLAASPLMAAGQISTPLLLIHAELDQNCPVSQSEQMLAALRQRGAVAELVRLPGEGHLVNLSGRPSRRLARARAVDTWLDRYLLAGDKEHASDS